MRRAACWLIGLALAAAGAYAHAQGRDNHGVERVRFRNIGVGQGLSQATGADIAQDRQGFIWVATQDGLDRFDGYGFRVYKHDRSDPYSLAANNLQDLLVDRAGRLWIGTSSGGLSRYDARLDRFDNFVPDRARDGAIGSEFVSALAQDRAGALWVATRNYGLQRFDEARGAFVDAACRHEAFRRSTSLLETDDRGHLLVGTGFGAFLCGTDDGSVREWLPRSGAHLAVRAMARAPNGDVWLTAQKQGLFHFDADGAEVEHFDERTSPSIDDTDITGVLVDRGGSIWFGSESSGLSRLNPLTRRLDTFMHAPEQAGSLAGNRAFSLFEDRDGQLWVGTWSNGISVFDPRAAGFVSVHPGGDARSLPGASVLSLLADGDGTFWFGTAEGGGLSHFDLDEGLLQRYVHAPDDPGSLAHNFVAAIARGRDGSLWVATRGGGLDRLRPGAKAFEHHRHVAADPRSIASDVLLRLHVDAADTLWIGTLDNGLDALCSGCDEFRHYAHVDGVDDSLAAGGVYAILEAGEGRLWVGTERGGIDLLDPAGGRVRHFPSDPRDPASLPANTVTALHRDRRGEVWIGTRGGGLAHLLHLDPSGARFETIDTHAGLAADAIGGLAEDAEGRIWMSTTVGISRYDPRDRSVVNIGADQGASATGYFISAVTQARDGRIAFGGPACATLFDPGQIPSLPVVEPVLTELRLFNTPVQPRWRDPDSPIEQAPWNGGEVRLDHRQSMLSINYGAPSAFAPASLRFAYRLDPHDSDWIETDAGLRTATYTRLAPGRYTFRVRARYPGQPWGQREATLPLAVLPAPWLSGGAIVAYVASALALFGFLWLRARRARREREAVQETIRQSEERLKLALWGSGSELWDIDLGTGRMHRDNRLEHLAVTHEAVAQNLSGYRPFVHPDDLGRFEHALGAHLSGRLPAFEASYRTKGSQHDWVWVLTRGRVVERDEDGRALRMSGTTSDINALNQALAALRSLNEQLESRVEQRTADLRSANDELRSTLERLTLAQRQLFEAEKLASLGGLVAGIAHEINTPLGIGVTAASHLQEEAARISRLVASGELRQHHLDEFQRTARESSEMILRNLQRADRLVKSFKQVAVDQSGEDRRVVDLGVCLDEILTTLGPSLKKTPHRVALDCPPGLIVETAPGALYQIVTNLVMNSLVHAFDAGRAGAMRIAVASQGRSLTIDYRDDGRGMDDAVRARMFEPFFTTRRGQGGSGLGMHIVYSLVTQILHGTIECESAPGAGTRFLIRFDADVLQQRG